MVQANYYETHCQRPARDLTHPVIMNAITTNFADKSFRTRSRYLSYMEVIFEFAVKRCYLGKSPLAPWKKPEEKPRGSLLTVADLHRIMSKAAPHLSRAMELAFMLAAPRASPTAGVHLAHR